MIDKIINEIVRAIENDEVSAVEEVYLKNQISMIFQRQIPKKPIKKTDFHGDILDSKYCPRCYRMLDRTENYCGNCGQAIDLNI